MYTTRTVRNGLKRAPVCPKGPRGIVTEADVEHARKHCIQQLRQGDYDSYLIRRFVPRSAQNAYDAIRTLNLELARLPETVSNAAVGRMRLQFWRDAVSSTFAGDPPREPISILLHRAVSDLVADGGAQQKTTLKTWLLRLVATRERHMDDKPFPSLAALEDYAENTYASLMYFTLAAAGLRSMHADHLASHVGKACGIVATLRGIPVLAAPATPVHGARSGAVVGQTRSPALLLPLDVMAETGVREEDVFRRGPDAEGLQDAVFKVATRANDHLITARDMMKNLRVGGTAGHDYEHEGEAEHTYASGADDHADAVLTRAFGVLLEAVPAREYLSRLEAANFDPFRVKTGWKVPWRLWQALSSQQI